MKLLKNKIQLGKLEDLTGFIKRFMSRAAPHVESGSLEWKEGGARSYQGKRGHLPLEGRVEGLSFS